jgi:HEPN domain-containing protein
MQIARQWLAKARNDLLNADNNLAASATPYDTVCFHCQQAAEKLLKAYLAAHSRPAPRTHDLLLLLERVLPLDAAAEQLRDALAILVPYAVEIRYPDDWFMPAEEDAQEARDAAGAVLHWLEKVLPEVLGGPPDA